MKIGLHDEQTDVAVVAVVRRHAPDAPLWVDANVAPSVRRLRDRHARRPQRPAVHRVPVRGSDSVGLTVRI
ncbi:hypothetical protein HKK72_31895 [Actinomadura sp. HBU206391]|nr:hypothetical protein [Actinomadura sp. HBU206391]